MPKKREYIDLSIDSLNTELTFQNSTLLSDCDEVNVARRAYRNKTNVNTFTDWFATLENLYFDLSNYGRTTFSQQEDYDEVTKKINQVRVMLGSIKYNAAMLRQSNNSSHGGVFVPDVLCINIQDDLSYLMRKAMTFQQSGSTEDQAGAAGIGAFLKAAQKEMVEKAKVEAKGEVKESG